MDIESPEHLERLRNQPEIKAAYLRFYPAAGSPEVRFERAPKNTLYWPAIELLLARFLAIGHPEEICEPHAFYARPCWLLATTNGAAHQPSYVIAVAAADGAPVADLVALLRDVSYDYWNGSSFFK